MKILENQVLKEYVMADMFEEAMRDCGSNPSYLINSQALTQFNLY